MQREMWRKKEMEKYRQTENLAIVDRGIHSPSRGSHQRHHHSGNRSPLSETVHRSGPCHNWVDHGLPDQGLCCSALSRACNRGSEAACASETKRGRTQRQEEDWRRRTAKRRWRGGGTDGHAAPKRSRRPSRNCPKLERSCLRDAASAGVCLRASEGCRAAAAGGGDDRLAVVCPRRKSGAFHRQGRGGRSPRPRNEARVGPWCLASRPARAVPRRRRRRHAVLQAPANLGSRPSRLLSNKLHFWCMHHDATRRPQTHGDALLSG
ncbi:DNA-directed RNA polymerase, alpha subunit, partial [Toxoplasma gondii MAS]